MGKHSGRHAFVDTLEKMGIHFVDRPHQHQMGKTDDIVRRLVARPVECPEDAARAAALVLGGSVGIEPARPAAAGPLSLPMPMGEPVSGPRKWLRSATSIFSSRSGNSVMAPLPPPPPRTDARDGHETRDRDSRSPQRGKKFDAPVPLSDRSARPSGTDDVVRNTPDWPDSRSRRTRFRSALRSAAFW